MMTTSQILDMAGPEIRQSLAECTPTQRVQVLDAVRLALAPGLPFDSDSDDEPAAAQEPPQSTGSELPQATPATPAPAPAPPAPEAPRNPASAEAAAEESDSDRDLLADDLAPVDGLGGAAEEAAEEALDGEEAVEEEARRGFTECDADGRAAAEEAVEEVADAGTSDAEHSLATTKAELAEAAAAARRQQARAGRGPHPRAAPGARRGGGGKRARR